MRVISLRQVLCKDLLKSQPLVGLRIVLYRGFPPAFHISHKSVPKCRFVPASPREKLGRYRASASIKLPAKLQFIICNFFIMNYSVTQGRSTMVG